MKQRPTPGAIRDGMRRVETATRELVLAIEQGDQAVIATVLAERGRHIQELGPHFATSRRSGGIDDDLRTATRALIAAGDEALVALQHSRAATGSMLARLAREAVAIRAYGDDLPAANNLNRSG